MSGRGFYPKRPQRLRLIVPYESPICSDNLRMTSGGGTDAVAVSAPVGVRDAAFLQDVQVNSKRRRNQPLGYRQSEGPSVGA